MINRLQITKIRLISLLFPSHSIIFNYIINLPTISVGMFTILKISINI